MNQGRLIKIGIVLALSLAWISVVVFAVWSIFRAQYFTARLVSVEFVIAKDGASFPGSEAYAGEDALVVRFESDMNLMHLAEMRQLQFRCVIDGLPVEDSEFFGDIFSDLSDPRWQDDIAGHASDPKQYMARIRLLPSEMAPDQLLHRQYDRMRCQIVGVMMAPGFYFSTEMVVPSDAVRRAVADALGK